MPRPNRFESGTMPGTRPRPGQLLTGGRNAGASARSRGKGAEEVLSRCDCGETGQERVKPRQSFLMSQARILLKIIGRVFEERWNLPQTNPNEALANSDRTQNEHPPRFPSARQVRKAPGTRLPRGSSLPSRRGRNRRPRDFCRPEPGPALPAHRIDRLAFPMHNGNAGLRARPFSGPLAPVRP